MPLQISFVFLCIELLSVGPKPSPASEGRGFRETPIGQIIFCFVVQTASVLQLAACYAASATSAVTRSKPFLTSALTLSGLIRFGRCTDRNMLPDSNSHT